jgi:hypothetical protein
MRNISLGKIISWINENAPSGFDLESLESKRYGLQYIWVGVE